MHNYFHIFLFRLRQEDRTLKLIRKNTFRGNQKVEKEEEKTEKTAEKKKPTQKTIKLRRKKKTLQKKGKPHRKKENPHRKEKPHRKKYNLTEKGKNPQKTKKTPQIATLNKIMVFCNFDKI